MTGFAIGLLGVSSAGIAYKIVKMALAKNSYNKGYKVGYNAGQNDVREKNTFTLIMPPMEFNSDYDKGYHNGYNAGRNAAFREALHKHLIWKNL